MSGLTASSGHQSLASDADLATDTDAAGFVHPWRHTKRGVFDYLAQCLALSLSPTDSATFLHGPVSQRMFTARPAKRAKTVSEIRDCRIISSLPQRASTGVSVGEKAVLVLKARNR